MRRGIIRKFQGSWGSGIGYLLIEDSKTHKVESIPCDNAPTVRALERAFGNIITEGHTANGAGYKGKEIYWEYDNFGLVLAGFTPVKEGK